MSIGSPRAEVSTRVGHTRTLSSYTFSSGPAILASSTSPSRSVHLASIAL